MIVHIDCISIIHVHEATVSLCYLFLLFYLWAFVFCLPLMYFTGYFQMSSSHESYPCTLCPRVYKHKSHLVRHRHMHHGGSGGGSSRHRVKTTCEYCERVFTSQRDLKSHVSRHHTGAAYFRCVVCDQRLITHSLLKRHIITQHPGHRVIIAMVWTINTTRSSSPLEPKMTSSVFMFFSAIKQFLTPAFVC